MFFRLKGECYLVKGTSGSAIYNLGKKEVISLNQEETNLLLRAENGEACGEDAVLRELQDMGWGNFSEKNLFIDKIRPYNEFMLMRPDLKPPVLENAYLQLTGRCGAAGKLHQHCRQMFCTPCRTEQHPRKELMPDRWKNIIDKLSMAGVKRIILTGGDITIYPGLAEVTAHCLSKNLGCAVVLNHFHEEAIGKIPEAASVIVYACQKDKLADYKKILGKRTDATLMLNEKMQFFQEELPKSVPKRVIPTQTYDVHIDENNIAPCGIDDFFQRKHTNTCLNGKMYLLSDGSVVPCYQKRDIVIGNLEEEHFSRVYRELANRFWNKPNKKEKCSSCQWYYGCSVCMCMEPENQCGYNLEQALWNTGNGTNEGLELTERSKTCKS